MKRGFFSIGFAFAACVAVASSVYAAEEQTAPTSAAPAAAQEPGAAAPAPAPAFTPPWASPDVLKVQLGIHLTPEQGPKFSQIVGQFINDRQSMIQMENRKGVPNLEQDINSHTRSLEITMDKQLKPILTPEQWKPYEDYKKVLKKQLGKMTGG